ncbi:cation diffusion facilitator family transporter [Limibacter armeniacum]|uniref:cation diffusion facilitator family transporter n=1 Tax=Limibacter armeniacum TaxID=466084 RepID=UPI002FE5A9A6
MNILKQHTRLLRIAVIVSGLLMTIKFTAYFMTASNSILSDAFESIVNVVASAFALYSIMYAAKPKDEDHPYGHGKIESVAASLEGMLVLMAGLGIIFKAAHDYFFGYEIGKLDTGIVLMVVTAVVNFVLGRILIKTGREHHSVLLVADGKHLVADTYSTSGIVVGLIIMYYTGFSWLDSLIAFGVGCVVAYSGFRVVKEALSGIMDEADYKLLRKVVKILEKNRKQNWIDTHNLRIIKYGRMLHLDLHMTMPYFLTVEQSHDEVKAVEELVDAQFHDEVEVFIHVDPCIPIETCGLCMKDACPFRDHRFEKKVIWDLHNVLKDERHTV